MLKIECNEKDVKDRKSHVEVMFQLKGDSHGQVVDEIAAALSTMYQQIPRDIFLDGLFESDFGKEVMKRTEGI